MGPHSAITFPISLIQKMGKRWVGGRHEREVESSESADTMPPRRCHVILSWRHTRNCLSFLRNFITHSEQREMIMNTKNIFVRTLTSLCLVIAITFMVMPAYANDGEPIEIGFTCDEESNKLEYTIENDTQSYKLEVKCHGDDTWDGNLIIEPGDGKLCAALEIDNRYVEDTGMSGESCIGAAYGMDNAKLEFNLESVEGDWIKLEFKIDE